MRSFSIGGREGGRKVNLNVDVRPSARRVNIRAFVTSPERRLIVESYSLRSGHPFVVICEQTSAADSTVYAEFTIIIVT